MLPEIRTILYCTDLSENSGYACRYAAYLARRTGANIHVLHVVEKMSQDALITVETYLQDFQGRESFLAERVKRTRQVLKERLDAFWDQLDEDDRVVRDQVASIDVCESFPTEEILTRSKKLGADLIVMGTHQKGVAHTFLGSVSKRVLSRSRIPALVVPLPEE